MKKLFTNFLGLALSVMVLASCSQMATYEQADLTPEEVAATAKNGFNLTPYGTGGNENAAVLAGGGDCTTDCIDETSGDLFAATGTSPTVNFGGGPAASSKTLSVSVWNTLTTIEYRITITGTGTTFQAGNLQYFDETIDPNTQLPIGWVTADGGGSLVANVAYVVSRPLTEGWEACDVVTEQWRQVGGGSPVSLGDVSYSLIGECSSCDIVGNEFTGAAVSCGTSREANFVFGSEEGVGYFKIQGGLTNFTGADAVVTIFDGLVDVTSSYSVSQRTPGGSSNRVITVEGTSLGECGSIRVNITWGSSNTGGVITGSWSVKDADGIEYAPEVPGLSCPI